MLKRGQARSTCGMRIDVKIRADKRRRMKKYIAGLWAAVLLLTGAAGIGGENGVVQAAETETTVSKTAIPKKERDATQEKGYLENRASDEVDAETAEWVETAGKALTELAAERDIPALVYLSDTYPVRETPSHDARTVVTVLSGQQVNILDVYLDADYEVWEYVALEYQGETFFGFVPRKNLACSDARFLKWETYYGMEAAAEPYVIEEGGNKVYADVEQFPESYRLALHALKEAHPNWVFVRFNTTLDWDTVIYNELQGAKSLVYKTLPDWAKNGLYDTGTWYYATRAALELYMDPRNALQENALFQFEQLTYNEEYHTQAALEAFLNNTFMKNGSNAPGTDMSYAYIFYMIGKEEGREVSPFHLAARVLQEQGDGTSPLISGTYPGYEGYYNYFNIGASGKTDEEVIQSGLSFAKNANWNSAYYSILGGSDFISANYIKKGQGTLYLQKFNVNPNGSYALYTHQYMQNISAPTTEAASIKKLYEKAGALESPFVFSIPVYENMPEEPCGVPTPDTKVTVAVPEGYTSTELWLDGVAYEGTLKDGLLTVTAPDKNARTAVMYRYNEKGSPKGMYAWSLSYDGMTYVATAQPGLEDLLSYHGFSVRVTGKSGIRYKTGISKELRSTLLSAAGVNGFRLREYGTLVMNNRNREQYPMILGGAKVISGLSYGKDSSGRLQDVVFETVDGRYRYTSVLIGMPVTAYKTEYAFRGYIILEKDGVSYTFYGAPMARSIYSLAEQLLNMETYAEGTDAHNFLKQLISDADALDGGTSESGTSGSTVSGGDAT